MSEHVNIITREKSVCSRVRQVSVSACESVHVCMYESPVIITPPERDEDNQVEHG